jgi:hypothetical protein
MSVDVGHGSAFREGGQDVIHTDTVSGATGYGQSAVNQMRFSGEPTQSQQPIVSTGDANYEDEGTYVGIKSSKETHKDILKRVKLTIKLYVNSYGIRQPSGVTTFLKTHIITILYNEDPFLSNDLETDNKTSPTAIQQINE